MKKRSLVLGLLALFLFASCGSNKWSCKKRYCKTPTEVLKEVNVNSVVTLTVDDCINTNE